MKVIVSSENPVQRVNRLIDEGAVIPDGTEPDREISTVQWSLYGLHHTNEIAVVARVGDLVWAKTAPSEVVYPAMVDRVFGMDVYDKELANSLGHELWQDFSGEIVAATAACVS